MLQERQGKLGRIFSIRLIDATGQSEYLWPPLTLPNFGMTGLAAASIFKNSLKESQLFLKKYSELLQFNLLSQARHVAV